MVVMCKASTLFSAILAPMVFMFVSMDSVCDVELLDFIQLLCQTFGFSVYKTCSEVTVYTRLLAALFLPGMWPVFCLRLIRATYPEAQSFLSAIALMEQKMTFSGQMFATTPMTQMKMTPTMIYCTYRRTSFFRQRRFLRF